MIRPRRFAATLWLPLQISLLAAGCQRGGSLEPPEIHYGQDLCAGCSMIISEERFACAYLTENPETGYESYAFDDIGCLFQRVEEGGHRPVAWYVKDYEGAGWIDARTAHFVRSAEIRSPMGSGVAATATADGAGELGERFGAEVITFERLRELASEEGLLRPPASGHQMGDGHDPDAMFEEHHKIDGKTIL